MNCLFRITTIPANISGQKLIVVFMLSICEGRLSVVDIRL
jgi:hypothetical protein